MKEVSEFLEKELIDFDNFKYEIESTDELIFVIFNLIFGNKSDLELTFKILGEERELFLHSNSFGWKPVNKSNMNKYFWIELLRA
jgi:hypothetical protein